MSCDDARISKSRCDMSKPLQRLQSEKKPEKPHPQLTWGWCQTRKNMRQSSRIQLTYT